MSIAVLLKDEVQGSGFSGIGNGVTLASGGSLRMRKRTRRELAIGKKVRVHEH